MQFDKAKGHEFYQVEFESVTTEADDVSGRLGLHPGGSSYQSMSPTTGYDKPHSNSSAKETSKPSFSPEHLHKTRPLGLSK